MNKKTITIVLGTARDGNLSSKAANYIYEILKENENIDVIFIDVEDYAHSRTIAPWDNNPLTNNWRKIVKKTDIFILVFPEYNHSFPGELKILLDGEFDLYKGKKVGLCGVSKGIFGGIRGVESIKPVLIELGMIINPYSVYFGGVQELFKQSKEEIDKHYKDRINKLLESFLKK